MIVVGHTQCGGAAACFAACSAPKADATTALARWLAPLTDLARSLEIASKSVNDALPVLIEENVKRQVENLAKSEAIVNAWKGEKGVWIHGWVYDIPSGKLKDLGVSRGGLE